MRQAVVEAEYTLKAADNTATTMGRLLIGRLRRVKDPLVLDELKKELRDFNMNTGIWK